MTFNDKIDYIYERIKKSEEESLEHVRGPLLAVELALSYFHIALSRCQNGPDCKECADQRVLMAHMLEKLPECFRDQLQAALKATDKYHGEREASSH